MLEIPIWEKINWTFEEAAAMTNIGEKTLRCLASSPECPFTLQVGAKTLIKREQFIKYNAMAKNVK